MESTPVNEPASPLVRLEIQDPPHGVRVFVLQGDCRVGRHSTNDLQLAHHRVSREHAWLKRDRDGHYWISDCGSSNGTFVNQQRVQHATRLVDGDLVRIGDFLLRFRSPQIAHSGMTTTEGSELTSIPQVRWLLVADIAGFSKLAHQLDSDSLRDLVARWRQDCHAAVSENYGHLNKQIGDGLLFYWSSDIAEPLWVVQALGRLHSLQSSTEPRFRVSLHLSEPNGVSLERRGMAEELIGGAVNFTFRMDDVAKALGVSQLVSGPAAEALRGHVTMESLGEAEVADFPGTHLFCQPRFESP